MNRYGENHKVFPQSESLARLMISMSLEQLRSCCALDLTKQHTHIKKKGEKKRKVWNPNQRNATGNQMHNRKSDSFIVPKKPVKADGGKGRTLYSFKGISCHADK